jgi:tRNA A-37 threonylcarbamoyl transferase component Bud32/tetratricopeptide (TPR) repeat protein
LQKLGKYEILSELGHGAMGVVYKARDPLIGRLVALKTINSALVDRPDLLERFYQEAQSAGKLQHPNIVTIFELGKEQQTPYIAMEYLDGESLEKAIANQTNLPLALKIGHVVRICQALEFAHKNRVVHRDVKPANIMVNSEGVVKVVDFGIARLMDFSRTNASLMIGTPAYMAPELFRKKKADARSDIWAVGVTFYELLCYQRPFTGEGYDIISSIMEDDFLPASSIVAGCPPELDAVIRRILTKSAPDRYQTMDEVLLDLEPVWISLCSEAASALVDQANAFYQRGDLAMTQETLRQARQIDSTNAKVKSLLEKVFADLRQREILPMLEEHLKRGRAFAQFRQFREAQAEAEAALELDSRNEQALALAAEVGLAAAQAQRQRELQQRIQDIRAKIERQEFTDAIDLARQTIATIGPDTDITQLLQAARVELEERNKKESQSGSLPDSQPFSPTDIQQDPPRANDAIDSALHPPVPTQPAAASSSNEPATPAASVRPRVQHAVPVLTPPPLPQPQTPAPPNQFQFDKPLEVIPAPPPPSGLQRKLAVLASVLALLTAAGFAYRYAIPKPAKVPAPTPNETSVEKQPDPNPPSNPVSPITNAVSDEQIAINSLAQAIAAYNRRDYAAAMPALDQALSRCPQNWPKRAQATDLLRKTQTRIQQQQHLNQAQSFLASKNFDAAKNEATQAISTPDGDPVFKNEASKLIAGIPAPPNPPPTTSPSAQPVKPPEPAPKDFKALTDNLRTAIAQQQWDDATSKLNSLPSDQPEYAILKQQIADGREDQAFALKKGELSQAETNKNESALRASKDYFNTVASQGGRHSADARNLVNQIDSDLKTVGATNLAPPTKPPTNAVASVRDDPADILAVLNRYADGVSKGDMEQVKAARSLSPSEEKKLRDTFRQKHGQGVPTNLNNCTAPQIGGDSATMSCIVVSGGNPPTPVTFSLKRADGQWRIVSAN